VLFAALAQAQDPLLRGTLERGPYPAGFRSSVALDESRNYDGNARPIFLAVWYPASNTSGPGIAYSRYLRIPDAAAHPSFRKRLEAFIRDVVSDDLFHKTEAALTDRERAAFDTLLATGTGSHPDAMPAQGRFPVVIYHSGAGGSYEDNSVLFEYLASHGYVVVSSAFQSPFPDFIGNNVGGIERSGPDLDFIVQQSRTWPYADGVAIAAIGHSAGAQVLLEWIGSPTCAARAFVSLDTTLEYTPENFQGHRALRDAMRRLTPPRIAVLLFAQARRKPRFSTFDSYLREAPRYEAAVAGFSHNDFLTHGYVGRALMQTPDAETVRRSYEEVCRTIRIFLDAWMKSNRDAARLLEQSASSSPVSIRHRPARRAR
jgi:hypothetical protein